MRRARSALTYLAASVYFVALALAHAKYVNVDPSRHDQQTYLDQGRFLAETSFHGVTNRVQMPLFDYVLAPFHAPSLDAAAWFWRAKLVAIGVAMVASALLWAVLRAALRPSTARLVALICVFYVFLPHAAYVQAEVAYELFATIGVLALLAFVRAPTLSRGVLAGALAGVAWLTKASFLLPLEIFLAVVVAREIFVAARGGSKRACAANLAMTAATFSCFAAVVYPYARTSRERWGSYLHNMSSTYVIYCDSWEDFQARMARLGSSEHWWKLADQSQVPSMSRFLATHSVGQMIAREVTGLALVIGNLALTPCAPFVIGLAVVAAIIVRRRADVRARLFRPDPRAPWLPVVTYFAIHALALGFYAAIAANARFSLSLVVPGLVLLAMAMSPQRDPLWERTERVATRMALAGLVVVVPVLVLTVYFGG